MPFLSKSPEDALFKIRGVQTTKLIDFQPILNSISQSYLQLVHEKSQEIELSHALDSFPLHLILTPYFEPDPLPDSLILIEVDDVFVIDSLTIEGMK